MAYQYIQFPHQVNNRNQVGGKAFALGQLRDFNIPKWFVVLPTAFYQSNDSSKTSIGLQISDLVKSEVLAAINELNCQGYFFACRSSALDEDGSNHSFAGQLETYLGLQKDEVCDGIIKVWHSGFSERVNLYRQENKLGTATAPAVIVQIMLKPEKAGVAFSVDPVTGDWDKAVVSGVWGVGNMLVDGTVDADVWQINRMQKITSSRAGIKNEKHVYLDKKFQNIKVDVAQANAFCCSDKEVLEIAALARKTSLHMLCPQDIEWAIEEGKLYLLQARPITTLGALCDKGGVYALWDNSNIAESYGGRTTPLTYSFVRGIYESVYRQFCFLMGVPAQVVEENEETFRSLLGLIDGRIYYNLLNWYKLLACFPGFSLNRRFMEQMMGVQEELGKELIQLIPNTYQTSKLVSSFRLGKALLGMGFNYFVINLSIKRFYIRLDDALAKPEIDFEHMRADELYAKFREMEKKLLLKWDAPLVNDFFAMIFFGVLKGLCQKWFTENADNLQNDLIGGDGTVISAEPAKRVKEMADCIRGDENAIKIFQNGTEQDIRRFIAANTKLNALYQSYLDKFGDRCLDELKLESNSITDKSLPLLRAIGHMAAREVSSQVENIPLTARIKADVTVREKLKFKFFKKCIFSWVLKQARARIRDRENLRFERTRLFGRVRKIFIELGKRYTVMGALEKPEDIFYLEKEEVLSFIVGTSSCPDLKNIALTRKQYFDNLKTPIDSADRFETYGPVYSGNLFKNNQTVKHDSNVPHKKGLGCCPGIVKGMVRVVKDPRGVELPAGCILVAERTDPGWIMLFPAAAGLIVERGSLLSHSAIVSRELGLPSVVGVLGVTDWLKDGDLVEFNGSTGDVYLITREENK